MQNALPPPAGTDSRPHVNGDGQLRVGEQVMPALATERAWCREALLRVSRTFALNIRCLSGRMLESVRLAYLLCRAADALEDSWPGPPGEMASRFDALVGALEGDEAAAARLSRGATSLNGRSDVTLLVRLPALLHVLAALDPHDADDIRRCVRTMALGMKRFATRAAERGPAVPYLDDDAELHEYCYVVAGCVGEMLTRLLEHGLEDDRSDVAARRLALAPVVGEALQLTNILLDWPVDIRAGRCHVPASWLAGHGLTIRQLLSHSDRARELSLRLAGLAHDALDRVPDYLDTIPTREHRYRLFCLLPALWARASLRLAMREPEFHSIARRPRLSRASVMSEALMGFVAHGSHGATRQALGNSHSIIS
ncbi:MAG TPA: squalene/phytoene synthase family protein [Methylomirabilota bacterium]|nr:squalene/phytoene synthase family protein [Methylomirabilota bacterium]